MKIIFFRRQKKEVLTTKDKIALLEINNGEKYIPLCKTYFPERFKEANKYLRREDKLRSYCVAALLKNLLDLREKDIKKTPYGKPFAENGKVHFSVSHSGNYVALAYGEKPLGVDIEIIKAVPENIIGKVFTSEEQLWLNQGKTDFFTLWTLKESVMKMLGEGFYLNPSTFSVLPFLSGSPIEIKNQLLYGATMNFDNHIISLCRDSKIENLQAEIWEG